MALPVVFQQETEIITAPPGNLPHRPEMPAAARSTAKKGGFWNKVIET
jgi:hypothetical protein